MFGLREASVWGASLVVAGGVAYFVWNYLSTRETPHPSEEKQAAEKSKNEVKEDNDGAEVEKSEKVTVATTASPKEAAEAKELSAPVPETVKQTAKKTVGKSIKFVKEDIEEPEDVKSEEVVVVASSAPPVVAVEAKELQLFEPETDQQPAEKSIKFVNKDSDGAEDIKSEEVVVVAATAPPVRVVEAKELSATVTETVKPRGTQVLVLGLDGSGKTSLLRSFTNSWSEQETQPTQGLNAVSINREDLSIEFVEIGGSAEVRQYWQKYMPKALMLVFVVDSSNPQLFPLAKTHLHELLVTDPYLPLMVLANKQDRDGASSITDLHDALSLSEVGDRKMFVIATYVQKEVEEPSSGVEDALEIIIQTIQMANESR